MCITIEHTPVFPLNVNPFNLRNNNLLKTRNIRTVYNGSDTVTFRGSEIWDQIPENIIYLTVNITI